MDFQDHFLTDGRMNPDESFFAMERNVTAARCNAPDAGKRTVFLPIPILNSIHVIQKGGPHAVCQMRDSLAGSGFYAVPVLR